MDKDEYWLLDSAIEGWYSIKWLVSDDIEGSFNKQNHGLNREQLISVLDHLFQRGDLLAERMEKLVPTGFFIPTQTEIEDALSGRLDCSYGLTSQGGARWEEVSQPRWERYITAGVYADPQEGAEVIGSDRQMVEKYDSLSHQLLGVSGVPGSKHWDVLEPWQATYWKVLPRGYRVRFSYEWVEPSPDPRRDRAVTEWLKEIQNWYTPYTE